MAEGKIEARCEALRGDMSLQKLFELTCDYGNREAAGYLAGEEEKVITFEQYKGMTRDYAAFLADKIGRGKRGQFILLQMDTSPFWFPAFWGLIMAGYNVVLADFNLTDEMTQYIITQSGAGAVILKTPRMLPGNILQILSDDLLAAGKAPDTFAPSFGEYVALCTSGTTDTSRIFVYNGEALANQVLNSELLHHANRIIIDDKPLRGLCFLPFHHVFGFIACLLWMPFIGYKNIYLKDRSPQTIISTILRFRVTHLMAVPILANNLSLSINKKVAKEPPVKRFIFKCMRGFSLGLQTLFPLRGMRFARTVLFRSVTEKTLGADMQCIILGGSHTPAEHMRTLTALGYYTVSGFGMTETALTSVETSLNVVTRTSGSVGRPFTSAEYRVQSDGQRSNRGEMYIRGNSMHTNRLIDGQLVPPLLEQDGWYRTGDVVRLEKGNRMYVEGRIKDVIINESGENVYPDEIEDAFSRLQDVDQFCVLGVHNAGKNAEKYKKKHSDVAYEDITLVLSVGDRYKDDVYLRTLLRGVMAINSQLTIVKKVTRVLATPEKLAMVNGIKVKRLALKEQIEYGKMVYCDLDLVQGSVNIPADYSPVTQAEAVPHDLQLEEIKQKIRHAYAETLEITDNRIPDDAHFINDLGGDSLQVLGMALKVEELFSVMIPVEEYGRCTTVNDLATLLYARIRGDSAYASESDRNDTEPVMPIAEFEESPEYMEFFARQQSLLAKGDNPYFVRHDSPLRDVSLMEGKAVLNFGSYNYTGMSGRKEVMDAAKAAIDTYGTSASGSRLLAGEKSLYQELETELAKWKHTESALVLVGGHSTNVTFVGNFCGKNDLIVYDALAHNSIEQGCRLSKATSKPFPHNDVAALESILRTQRHKFAKVLIIIEGVYSMDGDIANVPAFVAVKKKYGCFLMVDEAHSTCVIGKTGGGVDEYFGLLPDDIDIKMGTLSKGLGTCGGYLAGSKNIINYLKYNLPGFVFSVGISPPLAAAALEAIRLMQTDTAIMERMRVNISTFTNEAHKRGFNTCLAGETAIIPILVGQDENAFLLSNMLRHKGVFVPPAVYPAVPKNKARLRFCVISEHKPEQIVHALDMLAEAAREAGIDLPK
jgi:8-amino-7-oxononanoate synthase/acyl carrier protein